MRNGSGTSGRAGIGLSVVIALAGAGEGNASALGCDGVGVVDEAAKYPVVLSVYRISLSR